MRADLKHKVSLVFLVFSLAISLLLSSCGNTATTDKKYSHFVFNENPYDFSFDIPETYNLLPINRQYYSVWIALSAPNITNSQSRSVIIIWARFNSSRDSKSELDKRIAVFSKNPGYRFVSRSEIWVAGSRAYQASYYFWYIEGHPGIVTRDVGLERVVYFEKGNTFYEIIWSSPEATINEFQPDFEHMLKTFTTSE